MDSLIKMFKPQNMITTKHWGEKMMDTDII